MKNNLIFFKTMLQAHFSKMREVAQVSVISRRNHRWYYNNKLISSPPEGVIRWHTEMKYPHFTLNSREAVILGNSKTVQRGVLQNAGISVPLTWFDINDIESYPILARPQRHARGSKFYLVKNEKELKAVPYTSSWYFSEWIQKEREWRVYTGGGRVLTAFEKPVKGHLRGNIRETGSWGDLLMPPDEVCELAVAGTQTLGLDFSGVDVISDQNNIYVSEINTAPMFLSIRLAEIFRDYFLSCV